MWTGAATAKLGGGGIAQSHFSSWINHLYLQHPWTVSTALKNYSDCTPGQENLFQLHPWTRSPVLTTLLDWIIFTCASLRWSAVLFASLSMVCCSATPLSKDWPSSPLLHPWAEQLLWCPLIILPGHLQANPWPASTPLIPPTPLTSNPLSFLRMLQIFRWCVCLFLRLLFPRLSFPSSVIFYVCLFLPHVFRHKDLRVLSLSIFSSVCPLNLSFKSVCFPPCLSLLLSGFLLSVCLSLRQS